MSELTIEQRVQAGVEWLDENRPSWVEEIDLVELDMDSCNMCVLGQLFGNFWDAPISDTPPPIEQEELAAYHEMAGARGFSYGRRITIPAEEAALDEDLDALTAEWRRVIESRRAAVSS